MKLNINGNTYQTGAEPNDLLLWVLRDELGLTGTKFGCGIGYCGSCTVHVDGKPMRACVTPVQAVQNKNIRTIEGLKKGETLHPVQQAFVDHQVLQCGWCMSGQMMQAAALLEQQPGISDEELLQGMSGNFCRCGSYVRIREAVLDAAKRVREGRS
ncbi:(2Fe-2S)-binding protein [Deinococcus cellulosilyticus]|uniref:Oxidoreductase n=1 Tax=Deinococcus cellulosilyticus (strain DSM 18568 / NBRC 106333 / KACC 11606 / 5516J-15) TaxID=1223518 RepID=A0A511N8P0_DEIC1|nr:(2Fe-2S)-binding protein [Deinococcus cellulosilyticus]GEM49215.1 oxidoreductase [Deinococcus cellulosilyticus NBRC 106333 = KACC 11606]